MMIYLCTPPTTTQSSQLTEQSDWSVPSFYIYKPAHKNINPRYLEVKTTMTRAKPQHVLQAKTVTPAESMIPLWTFALRHYHLILWGWPILGMSKNVAPTGNTRKSTVISSSLMLSTNEPL